ncbi:hypothetical protein [Propionivibrio soli]|uniref:hypothetical protein n=1 Tax=Propionivibrio soli TaxID=2976531 RepID=UPI0021E8A503|nr:hypothetical protein [Propionivibrio soli]
MSAKQLTARKDNLKVIVLSWVYPALRQLPLSDWDAALRNAKDTESDSFERWWAIAGLGLITYLLAFDGNQTADSSLPARYLAQFLMAVPLIVVVMGPAHVRRVRRGLNKEIERRRSAERFEL